MKVQFHGGYEIRSLEKTAILRVVFGSFRLIAEKKDPFILFGNRPKCETKTTEKRTLQQHLQLNGLFIK